MDITSVGLIAGGLAALVRAANSYSNSPAGDRILRLGEEYLGPSLVRHAKLMEIGTEVRARKKIRAFDGTDDEKIAVEVAALGTNVLERLSCQRREETDSLKAVLLERVLTEQLRDQINQEQILHMAAGQVPPNAEISSGDPDWLREFWSANRHCSREDVQLIWARMLQMELREPGSFSLKAIEALRLMDPDEREALMVISRYRINFKGKTYLHESLNNERTSDALKIRVMQTARSHQWYYGPGYQMERVLVEPRGAHIVSLSGGYTVAYINHTTESQPLLLGGMRPTRLGEELLSLPDEPPPQELMDAVMAKYPKFEKVIAASDGIESGMTASD